LADVPPAKLAGGSFDFSDMSARVADMPAYSIAGDPGTHISNADAE
jgi:hypothetical protein